MSKSFVSLSFSVNKLQVLKLNSSKKKVDKFSTLDLPDGLIRNHKVQDKEYLAKVLKSVWKKVGLKEKSVGIVVPEFSTFTKLMTLPKLEYTELNEAVEWQAHDFLPTKVRDMSMDWKIVKRLDDNYQVLAVAMEKEVLSGYVDAAGLAGLFPLVVEPPSLSLVRVSGNTPGAKLIIYEYFDEVILIVADGIKVFGSSVVATKNKDELAKTALNIVRHYSENQVEHILVGGLGLDQNLIKRLQDSLKKPVNRLNVNITGLSEQDIQNYLIPISLQHKKPTDPSDEETINLLPKEVVEKYKHKIFELQIWTLMMAITFIVWSSFLAAVGSFIFLSQQITNLKSETPQLNRISETQEVRAQIKEINDAAAKTLTITKAFKSPSAIFNAIEVARPEGIEIIRYSMDLDDEVIDLNGRAAIRSDLINFKQSLEENEDFSHIAIPISNFEVESNLNFNISFLYKFK